MRPLNFKLRGLALVSSSILGLGDPGASRAAACTVTVGVVMELTGTAGAYGQAAEKSVEMAFRDLNEAEGTQGCRLVSNVKDTQSQGTVAIDAANQLVQLAKVPVLIGSIISATTIEILTAVTGPAKVLQVSPAASSPKLTALAREGKTGGLFLRTITSDSLQGGVAAKFALDHGMRRLSVIYVNNDFGVDLYQEFARAYKALGGVVAAATPYNEKQSSYNSEVSALVDVPADGLYLISTPVDGATIARSWISAGGVRKFLLNDGMNSNDFIRGVGAKYLDDAYGTSSGTVTGPSSQYFDAEYRRYAGLDPGSPAADRAYDAAVIVGLAIAAAARPEPAAIRAAVARVTDPAGTVIHAGKDEFVRALALLKHGKTIRYEGVIGAVSFDPNGDITGPFRLWKIDKGVVDTIGAMSIDEVAALEARLGRR